MAPMNRGGSVTSQRSGDRWTAAVQVDERDATGHRQYDLSLNRTFPTEAAARRAGEQLLAEWKGGRVLLRDVLLRQLAGTYRTLRETYKPMQPPTVPATRSAWDRAITTWEEQSWIDAAAAARCRDHVRSAFEAESGAPVRRHRLPGDAESDPTL